MRSISTAVLAAVALAAAITPTSADAASITLSSPVITSGPITGPAVIAGPKPAVWVGGTWWSPEADQEFSPASFVGGSLPGTYTYDITFDLTGFDHTTAVLAGAWTTDNNGSIYFNGVLGGSVGPTAYNTTTAFNFTGFLPGVNTLRFVVVNEDATGQPWGGPNGENPTGVHFSIREATVATPVPEPATLALLGLGLVGVAAARRRMARR